MSLKRAGQVLSTGLGVASWTRWLAAMGVVAAVCSFAAFGMGVRWERGVQALSEVKQQRTELKAQQEQIADLRQAATDIKQSAVDLSAEYRDAVHRQGNIANEWIRFSSNANGLFKAQTDRMGDLIGAMPNCAGNDRVLEHWRAAARLASPTDAAGPAATVNQPGAADAVRPDAGGTGRPLRDADPRPRR